MHTLRNAFLAAALCLAGSSAVLAVEVEEIVQLVQSGVDDAVIVNMVNATFLPRPLTTREVMLLNAIGASPALLEYLTRPEVVNSAYVASPPTEASVIVTPSTVVYDYWFYPVYRNYWYGSFYRPYWSWGVNYWWGNSWWNSVWRRNAWWGGPRRDSRRSDRWAHARPRPPLFRPGPRSGVARSVGPRSGFGPGSVYGTATRPSLRASARGTRGTSSGARAYASPSSAGAIRSPSVSARPDRTSRPAAAARSSGVSARSSASGSAAVGRAASGASGRNYRAPSSGGSRSSYRAPSGGGRSSPGRIIRPDGGGHGRR